MKIFLWLLSVALAAAGAGCFWLGQEVLNAFSTGVVYRYALENAFTGRAPRVDLEEVYQRGMMFRAGGIALLLAGAGTALGAILYKESPKPVAEAVKPMVPPKAGDIVEEHHGYAIVRTDAGYAVEGAEFEDLPKARFFARAKAGHR